MELLTTNIETSTIPSASFVAKFNAANGTSQILTRTQKWL